MANAYVLLNTEIGAESEVVSALRKIEGVKEVHSLWGVYDVIAKIRADNVEDLKYIITQRMQKIRGINSKLTMIIHDNPLTHEHVVFEPAPIFVHHH
jgi:DNA-binding Lrp family transcriptional regulator